jgi:tetratricopeptide (TPR) repeat protein
MRNLMLLFAFNLLAYSVLYAQPGTPARPGQAPKLNDSNTAMEKAKTKPKDKKMGLGRPVQSDPVENKEVAKALNMLETGKSKAAAEKLDDYAENDADASYGLGVAYYQMGKPEKAIEAWEHAVALDSSDNDALYQLGQIYEEQHDLEKAEEAFIAMIENDPNDADAWYELGYLYSLIPDLKKDAELCFNTVLELEPGDPYAAFELSRLLAQQNKQKGALEKLELAFKNGFKDLDLISEDPDLNVIESTSQYKALIDKYFPE